MKKHLLKLAFWLSLMGVPTATDAQQNDWLNCYNVQRALEVFDENPQEASQFLSKEVNARPLNGYAWLLLARCFKTVDNYGTVLDYTTRAIECLKTAQHDNAWLAMAYTDRAEAYGILEKSDDQLLDLNAAVRTAQKLRGDDATPDPLLERAQYYFDNADYKLSDADYNAAIKVDSHHAVPYIGLSRNAYRRGEYDLAIEMAKKSVEADPDYHYYHLYLLAPYRAKGDYEHEAEELVEAISNETTSSDAGRYVLDSINMDLFEPLKKLLDERISKTPDNSALVFAQLSLASHSNNHEDAVKLAQKFVDLYSENAFAFASAANVFLRKGDPDRAYEYVKKAYQLDSLDYDVYSAMINVCNDLEHFDEARLYVQKAIELFPDYAELYYLAARVEAYDLKYAEAVELSRIACLLDPEDLAIREQLMCYMGELGLEQEMMAVGEQALKIDTVPVYNSRRAIVLAHLGRFDEALSWLEKKIEQKPLNLVDIYISKAETLLMKGDDDGAREAYREAVKAGWARHSVLKHLPHFRDHLELFENL